MQRRKDILYFLVYTFLLPLLCVMIMKQFSMFSSGGIRLILYAIEGASPFLAVVLIMIQRKGVAGLKEYTKQKYICNLHMKYVMFAIGIPLGILTLARLVTYFMGYSTAFIRVPSGKKIVIILWALIAEELGWRGYLQDELNQIGISKEWLIPLITGVIWTLWHYHFYLLGTMDSPILIFGLGCILESYGYYSITKMARGNIVPASVWHFVGNLFFNAYMFGADWNDGSVVPFLVANLFYAINLVIFLGYQREKNKIRNV